MWDAFSKEITEDHCWPMPNCRSSHCNEKLPMLCSSPVHPQVGSPQPSILNRVPQQKWLVLETCWKGEELQTYGLLQSSPKVHLRQHGWEQELEVSKQVSKQGSWGGNFLMSTLCLEGIPLIFWTPGFFWSASIIASYMAKAPLSKNSSFFFHWAEREHFSWLC